MSFHPLAGFFLCCLVLSVRAGFLLVAHFHTYENTLHAYRSTTSANGGRCCSAPDMSPPNCTAPCATILQYCFKEYGTNNSFSNDAILFVDCLWISGSSGMLINNTNYIDFSSPPLTVFGRATPTTSSLARDTWPGRIQFFVLAAAGNEVVDYLALDFSLSPGETLDNQTLSGHHFGSDVTFTVSFSLTCRANFYGSNCTVHCRPADSDELVHYSCLSDGRIQCLEGYQNETGNCTECVLAEGCQHGSCDSPGECRCAPGYSGDLCEEEVDVCGTSPCQGWEVCTNTGPGSHKCSCMDGYEGANCSTLTEDSSGRASALAVAVGSGVGGIIVIIIFLLIVIAVLMVQRRSHAMKNAHVTGDSIKMKSNPVYGAHTAGPSDMEMQTNPVYGVQTQQLVEGTYYMNEGLGPSDPPPVYDYIPDDQLPLSSPSTDIPTAENAAYGVATQDPSALPESS